MSALKKAKQLLKTYRDAIVEHENHKAKANEHAIKRDQIKASSKGTPTEIATKMADEDREYDIQIEASNIVARRAYDSILPDLCDTINARRVELSKEQKEIESMNCKAISEYASSDEVQDAVKILRKLHDRVQSRAPGIAPDNDVVVFLKVLGWNMVDTSSVKLPGIQNIPDECETLQALKRIARSSAKEMQKRGIKTTTSIDVEEVPPMTDSLLTQIVITRKPAPAPEPIEVPTEQPDLSAA